MVSATKFGRIRFTRLAGLAIVLATGTLETGCARLASFRKNDSPAFGTEPATTAAARKSRLKGNDLYADLVGRPEDAGIRSEATGLASRAKENEAVAGASAIPRPAARAEPTAPPPVTQEPRVALQPPVTLSPTMVPKPARTGQAPEIVGGPQPLLIPPPESLDARLVQEPPARALTPKLTLDSILTDSRKRLDALSTYQVKMNHQERVGGSLKPAEDVLMSIKRSPKAVRFEWQDGANKGREVIYAAEANGGLMHVRIVGPLGVLPRLSLAPDSPLVSRSSRHPITEAGFDTIIHNMEEGLNRQRSGVQPADRLAYEGLESNESLGKPSHKIVRITQGGETWLVYLDPETLLPSLVQANAANGELLERYVFKDPVLDVPELAKAGAFDPDARWGPPKGLFQRVARSGVEAEDKTRAR